MLQNEQPIEVDLSIKDTNEGYLSASIASSTTSVNSSIYNYVYENGRRYHAYRSGAYVMPNDEAEQDRLDLVHHLSLVLFDGKLTLAPIGKSPQRILDVGTGTGIWALDAADRYPSAEVIAFDLSPIQPGWVFPNCRFEVEDAESEWTYAKNSFDLIHSRHLAQSIRDWPRYISQIYDHLKPGAWVQILESELEPRSDDGSHKLAKKTIEWYALLNKVSAKKGIPPMYHKLKGWVEDAGFVEVQEIKLKVPWAPWAKDKKMKELGRGALFNSAGALEAYGLHLLTMEGGMSLKEAKASNREVLKEIENPKYHMWGLQVVIIARKPLAVD